MEKEKKTILDGIFERPPNRIRELREKAGMTANDLSRLSGIFASTISQLENGKAKIKEEHLQKIADSLHIHPSELSYVTRVTMLEEEKFVAVISAIRKDERTNHLKDDEFAKLCFISISELSDKDFKNEDIISYLKLIINTHIKYDNKN